jgi:hypothetical protein
MQKRKMWWKRETENHRCFDGSYELHVSQFYIEQDQRRITLTNICTKHTEQDQRRITRTNMYTKHTEQDQ